MHLDQGRDFFISYTGVNRSWAEWIAVQLEANGYSSVLQAFDFRPGTDFVHQMHEATSNASRTIAVLSPAYFASAFSEAEWRVAFAKDPSGDRALLVPVRVQPCDPPGLLMTRVYVDLVDADEATARKILLDAVNKNWKRPRTAAWPGAAANSRTEPPGTFPGAGPGISNLPRRNQNFTGRDGLLEQIHTGLLAGSMAAVVPTKAVYGLGGIGKTQLALEYAHRFRSDYDITWWIPAQQPTATVATLAGLARRLGIPEQDDRSEMVTELFDLLRGRDRWLMVYDNAEEPHQLIGLLPPGGGGQVLVTSRWAVWGAQASPLRMGVLSRDESVGFLHGRTGLDDPMGWDAVAELLGDLPLALEEAAAYLEETGESVLAYLELVRDRAGELFGLTEPFTVDSDHRRIATIWSVSLDRVRQEEPAAEALLSLCTFLAPDVPRGLPVEQPELLPGDLGTVAADRLAYNRTLAVISRYSLATVSPSTVSLHRLVQAVIQARLNQAGMHVWIESAVNLVRACFPNDSWETTSWSECERLLPQVLSVTDHAERHGVAGASAGWLLQRASTYLRERGQYQQARVLAQRAVMVTEAALGPDNLDVAWCREALGRTLQDLGELFAARIQFSDAVRIGEAALGPEHSDVGTWRGNLGRVLQELGNFDGAREELERALRISEATLGADHPIMGVRRDYLARVLQAQGDLVGARAEFERACQVSELALGVSHPVVATRRYYYGRVLHELGELDAARDELERAVRISEAALGADHPVVRNRHAYLALVLRDLGDPDKSSR